MVFENIYNFDCKFMIEKYYKPEYVANHETNAPGDQGTKLTFILIVRMITG